MLQSIFLLCAALVAPCLAGCSHSMLQQATTHYVASQTAGHIGPLSSAAYTENFKAVDIKTGVLSQPLKIDHSRSIHDTAACATFTELIVTDPGHPYVIGTQMHFTQGKVAKIDSIVTDAGDWLFNATGTLYWSQRESWDLIPKEKRDSRETIQKAAEAYLDKFNDNSVVVPWGTPCARLEGGAYTGQGLPTDSCDVGFPSGVSMLNRRYVVDPTMGSVNVFFNFGGNNSSPDSHQFRLQEGKVRYVHTMTVTKCAALPEDPCNSG